MKVRALLSAFAAYALAAPVASGDVKASAPDGLVIQVKGEVALDRVDAWDRLVNLGSWWSAAHTYSGDAKYLSVDAVAGGCWCEIWEGGEVEHGRVINVGNGELLRFEAPLGPLQGLGVSAVLTFTLADGSTKERTAITADFHVTGSSLSGLDKLAPLIDQVLSEQVKRFTAP
jgi:hypothetical protein